MNQLLTHSRAESFKRCRKHHQFAYEIGIRSKTDAKSLRMGSAYHDGIEALSNGLTLEQVVDVVRLNYETRPDDFDGYWWAIESETVVRLVCGYQWKWANDRWEHIAAEKEFRLPLLNPATGKATPNWDRGGKIDGIIKVDDRYGVKECKLLGDDIGPESDLWPRLRIDQQISNYVTAARDLGYPVGFVMYDVARKPTITPTAVPLLDSLGIKIVLDANGERVKVKNGDWRQTGSTADGYVLQTRPMTVDEWGDKLNNDIAERPDFYYARHEIARLDQDIAEYQAETWDVQKTIREAQLSGRWFRTVNKNTCNFCEFFALCSSGFNHERDALPEQFVRVENVNPELKGSLDGYSNRAAETSSTAAAEDPAETVSAG